MVQASASTAIMPKQILHKFRINNISPDTLDKERERTVRRILAIVQKINVFEVGSTAVAGVIGKQDLDFLVLVTADEFDSVRSALDKAFARNPHQLSNDYFQGYTVESELDIAIQLTIKGSQYDNFLEFLTVLRESAALRHEYNALKLKFNGALMADYQDAKHEFITRVLALN